MRKAAKWSDLPPSRVPDLYLTSLLATFMCIFRHLQIDIWFDVSENYEKILQVFFKNIQIPYQIWNGCFMAFIVSIWTSIGNKDYYWSVLVKSRMGLGVPKIDYPNYGQGLGGSELVSPFWKKWQYVLVRGSRGVLEIFSELLVKNSLIDDKKNVVFEIWKRW